MDPPINIGRSILPDTAVKDRIIKSTLLDMRSESQPMGICIKTFPTIRVPRTREETDSLNP